MYKRGDLVILRDGSSDAVYRVGFASPSSEVMTVCRQEDYERIGYLRAAKSVVFVRDYAPAVEVFAWDSTPPVKKDAPALAGFVRWTRANVTDPLPPHNLPRGLFLCPDGEWREMTLRDYWRDHARSR